MRGLTFHGDQDVRVEDVPDAQIQKPTDAVVKVTMAGICASDLHILNAGTAFGFEPGSRLGHEFIGTVEEVGAEVTNLRPGDRVLASCSVLDGSCPMCHEHLHSSCNSWSLFGWAPRTWRPASTRGCGRCAAGRRRWAGSRRSARAARHAPHSAGPAARRRPPPR